MRGRAAVAVVAVLAVGGATAAMSAAQAPPAAGVTITLAPREVAVAGGEGIAAGPTRIEFRNTGRRAPIDASLVALRPGVTFEQLRAAVARSRESPTPVKRVATFEAGGGIAPGATYATTIDLKPSTTYVVANVGERPQDFVYARFTTGAAADPPPARPTPVATVALYDYAFGMPSTLPRNGIVRFENRGERIHFALAFRLRRAADRVRGVRALLRNDERALGRLFVEEQFYEPLGIVSGGVTNDVEVRVPRAGDYVMVCFLGDGERGNPSHNQLGMVKAFSVR